ncbi:MAG: hypothetical protein AAB654_05570 [Acidobacteriota bacterium]
MTVRSCPLSRREFGAALCSLPAASLFGAQERAQLPWNQPASVARVYVASPTVHWPKPDLDVERDRADVEARMSEVARKHGQDVRFVGGELLRQDSEVEGWLKKHSQADAILIFPMTAPAGPLNALVNAAPAPMLYFHRPYAGHSWSSVGGWQQAGKRIAIVASSTLDDLDPYIPIFRAIQYLRNSKVLVVAASPKGRQEQADAFTKQFGTQMKFFTYDDLKAVFESADARKAEKEAEALKRAALKVVEPKPQEITDAMRFYLGVVSWLERERANAITLDCFPGLLAKKLPAYPCIAWSKLNDAGYYGVCEGDIQSTMTQMLITPYSGMPGFVTDPVFDTSRNEVIHAHCVSATRMKGIHGPSSPFILRNHLETAEGAVMQVLVPANETITCARFVGAKKFLVSTGEVTGNVDSDRGCRTQFRTRVADAQKMLENYSSGLHRVIFYGDHVRAAERMGKMLGFQVVREG